MREELLENHRMILTQDGLCVADGVPEGLADRSARRGHSSMQLLRMDMDHVLFIYVFRRFQEYIFFP